ncbi:methyltransferase family protein [Mycobacterium sp. NPDC051804]|uniref:methyltransferase family protein n=1 Tax=Mycobacterium sp. NPDC051804 TaxID=3364295 RepID=UPI003792B5F2
MANAVQALFAAMMLVMGALRAAIQRRHTGEIGTRRSMRPDGSLEWWALAGTDLGWLTVGIGAPVADLAGMSPLAILDHSMLRGVGVAVAVLGIVLAFTAQMAMGASWRTGIDEAERTTLVTTGAFRVVRNPVFAAATVAFIGLALMVPNAVAVAGLVVSVIGIEAQVRFAEEPYLRRVHGVAYTSYASRVGRFLPGIGRLQPEHQYRS